MKRIVAMIAVISALAAWAADTIEPVKNGNTWTFTVTTGTATYTSKIEGSVKVVKEGVGTLDLGTGANTFTGGIAVNRGKLQGTYSALGGKHELVTVSESATLAIVNTTGQAAAMTLAETLEVAGSGSDGQGAVQRPSGSKSIHNLFQNVTLKGDATFSATKRWGFGGGPTACKLDMGGHKLTIISSADYFEFYGNGVSIANPGDIEVTSGTILVQAPLFGDSFGEHVMRFRDGTTMNVYGADMTWPVIAPDAMTISVTKANAVKNVLREAVTFGTALTWSHSTNTISSTLTGALSGAGTLQVQGPGTVSVTGTAQRVVGSLAVTGSQLVLKDAGSFVVTNQTVGVSGFVPTTAAATVSGKWGNVPRLSVIGNSFLSMPSSANGTTQTTEKHHLMLGRNIGEFGVLEIGEGATVSNDLNVGRYAGSVGAVYLKGGKLYWRGGSANQGWLGMAGDGYMSIDSGEFVSEGLITMGRSAGNGIVRQRGGSVTMTSSSALSLRLARETGSYAHWCQTGGTFSGAHHAVLCHADALLNQDNVEAVLTVAGQGSSFSLASGKWVIAYVSSNAVTSVLNLNDGGCLSAAKIFKERKGLYGNSTDVPNFNDPSFRAATAGSKFFVNSDGGVIKVLNYGTFFQNNFGSYDDPDRLTVYAGGLTVDTTAASSSGDVSWSVPIRKPSGNVLLSVSLPTDASFVNKYIAPPRVVISGANTHGATAVAELDETTGQLTGITVTSAGNDVPNDISISITSGDLANTFSCPFVVGAPAKSGGLVKKGPGTLRLTMSQANPNTYEGETVVEEGVLEFSSNTYPTDSPLVLKGGEISFSGTATRTLSAIGGYGTIATPGSITVTNVVRLSCEDLFGKGRTINSGKIRFADGVKLVVTDPEKLVDYTGCDKTAFLMSTDVIDGRIQTVELDESYGRWRCTKSNDGKSLLFGKAKGIVIVVQ